MQLPDISDTAASNVVRLADTARKTRVLYAGDMEFAKAQFASVAPQLHLIPAATILGRSAEAAPASGESPDAALIDCGAGVDARSIVDSIRARGLDVPIVLALDPGGAEDAPTKLTADLRVDDYTVKLPGWLARLTSRLEFAIAHHRRRRSLDALQASSERLRTVVESAPVCLARVTRDGTILAMNAAAMKMVDADTSDDVLGKSLLAFVDSGGADDVRRFLDAVSAGQAGSLEFQTTAIAGTARVVDTRAVPLSPDTEGRASALLVLRDATERKRLEESMLAHAAASTVAAPDAAKLHAEERDALRQQLDAALEECRRIESEREALKRETEETRARAAMVEHVRAACTAAEQQLHDIRADYERVAAERNALRDDLTAARLRHDAAAVEQDAEREKHREVLQASDTERTGLAARCEALEAVIASMESRQAAEREEHRTIRADFEAALRERDHGEALASEREALQASLGSLRSQFEEMTAALDAADARHAAAMHDHRAATDAIETQLRETEQTRAALAAERDELRAALEAAHARHHQLQAMLDEAHAGREAQIAYAENGHRALAQRIDELQARLDAAVAERDAVAHQLRADADAASARAQQSMTTVEELRTARDAHAADASAAQAKAERLQAAIDELRTARDARAADADNATAQTEHLRATIEELRVARDAQAADAAAAHARSEQLRAAIEELRASHHAQTADAGVASARAEQLAAELSELRAERDTHKVEADAVRQALGQRVDELQARVDAALAERDAIGAELRRALEAAAEHSDRLQATLNDVRASRDTQVVEGEAVRHSLTQRVEELQTRLDAVIIDREALERALADARADLAARLTEASAARESLQHRLEERDAENARLRAEHASLEERRHREAAATAQQARLSAEALEKAQAAETSARTAAAEAAAKVAAAEAAAKAAAKRAAVDALATARPATPVAAADLHDAQVAFREAFQLISGELQTVVENTRAEQAALLRHRPLGYDVLEDKLRQAEAECRRLASERDDRDATVRALQAEIDQHIELRRQQRKELVRALQESDATERRAVARLAECNRMRQMLTDAQSALQRLSKWASTQSTRLAAPSAAGQRALPPIEAPAPRSASRDDEPSAPPLEASWS